MADRLAAFRNNDLESAPTYESYALGPYPTDQAQRGHHISSSVSTLGGVGGGGAQAGDNYWDHLTDLRSSLDRLKSLTTTIANAAPPVSDDPYNGAGSGSDVGAEARQEAQALIGRIKTKVGDLEEGLRNPDAGDETKGLLGGGVDGWGGSVAARKQKATALSAFSHAFRDIVGELQTAEAGARRKEHQRLERLVRVVKPDASQDELQHDIQTIASSSDGGAQLFQSALMGAPSARVSEATSAQASAASRAASLRAIERSLTDLAQLMRDVAIMVNEQDDLIRSIEENAGRAERDVRKADVQIKGAKISAQKFRSKRWICFGISVLAVIIIVVVVVIVVLNNKKSDGGGGGGGQ